MNDLANQIATTQHFAVEFEDQGVNRLMSVKFWKGDTLCRIYVCRCGLPSSDLTGELGSLSSVHQGRYSRLFRMSSGADSDYRPQCFLPSGCPELLSLRAPAAPEDDAQTHFQCVWQNRLLLCSEVPHGFTWSSYWRRLGPAIP